MKLKRISYLCGPSKPLISKTIGDLLHDAAKRHPKSDACVFHHEGVRWSYRELLQRAEQIAHGFSALGLKRQSRIGIFAPTCKEWILTQFGAALSDLILVNLNPAYRRNELLYALNSAGCEALVTSSGFKGTNYVKMLNEICPEIASSKIGAIGSQSIPSLKWLIKTDDTPTQGMLNFKDLVRLSSTHLPPLDPPIDFESPANIQFTSGTTGSPKGTVLTHHSILNNASFQAQHMGYTHSTRLCIPVPLYHCAGMVMGNLACLTHASTMVFHDYGFNAAACLDAIEKERCTSVLGVPTMYQAVMNEQQRKPRVIASLKDGIIGGASSTPDLIQRIINEMHLKIAVIYGMTEGSPVIAMTHTNDSFEKQANTVGVPFPCTEVKVVGEKGETVPQGHSGEVCYRGYLTMKEYWNNPKATRETLDEGQWLHSGDLGVFDSDMYLKIIGRKKDMIIRGGENIFPAEVEAFYCTHPDIEEVHVIGVPDDYYGEVVCAWVKVKPGKAALTADDLKQFGEGKIAYYKVPAIVRTVKSFPLTVSGKVMKFAMKEEEAKVRNR